MGVIQMFTYIKTRRQQCVENVDLVQMAANRPGGIKLLVDFYAWEHFIKFRFKRSLDLKTDNPYLILCGGEYKQMRDYMVSFVEALRSVNIELMFFLDGAKGSSDLGTSGKWNTWVRRQIENIAEADRALQALNGEIPFESLDFRELTRPCLQEVQNILTLQNLGCKIHPVLSGEADTVIARHFQHDEQAVAVFTTDTDFCIFPDSVYMSDRFFDIHNDLKMIHPSLSVKKPTKLICGFVRSDDLYQHFGFQSVSSLCELSILVGNDFTLPILNQINAWSNYVGKISKVATLVQEFGTVENCPMFVYHLTENPELQRAVQLSRDFYSLARPEENNPPANNATESIISKAVSESRFPGTIYAMYRRFYWHRVILEDPSLSDNTAERALVYLRSYVYTFLLPPNQDTVTEYGRTPLSAFEEMTALKIKQTPLPPLPVLHRNSFQKNRALFHLIMSHQEYSTPDFNKSYFRLYGTKLGFTCYILRYFLLLNWHQNLYITAGEFLILCSWVLGYHDPEKYLPVQILPGIRCVTLENWLLCLFRTSHAFLGNVLNLAHEFPAPADLFSGAVWVNLYTASKLSPEYRHQSESYLRLPPYHVKSVNASVLAVLKERKHVIENIVRGLFPVGC